MYLQELDFARIQVLRVGDDSQFEPGITCVVGPNGSGKSNVVDALNWVMGEQGRQVRYAAGRWRTSSSPAQSGRAPLGRAEVVLTIDNSDGCSAHRLLRGHHLTNDVPQRRLRVRHQRNRGAALLDIHELLSDSGIGREMHVIVGQGQLDSILQATPEIRRGFIEEAAGVLKHRKRKEKAVRKLEACEANLNRLSDLINEIRRQLKPLGRQAEVARKAAIIQAEARDARGSAASRRPAPGHPGAAIGTRGRAGDERASSSA